MKKAVIEIALACLVVGIAAMALAVPLNQVLRIETNQTLSGACCFTWGETVSVTEPKVVAPVIVTFSTDYRATEDQFVGISVNNHPCMTTQEVGQFAPADGTFRSENYEWVVMPTDGLLKGSNTITLCGGGGFRGGSVTLGFNTLAVRLSK